MDPILGQDEVNALLDAIKMGGLADDVSEEGAPAAVAYDLTSNQRVVRGRMPALEIVNDRQARLHRSSLSTIARRVVDAAYRSTSLLRFGEIQAAMPSPSCCSIVTLAPLTGYAAICFDTSFLFSILDILFGGPGSGQTKRNAGDLTAVEVRLTRRLVDAILADMERAWAPLTRIRGEFVRTESNPRFVTIAAPGDVMVEITYDLEVESLLTGSIQIVIPYASLQPLRSRLSSALQGDIGDDRDDWAGTINDHVLEVDAESVALLGTARMQLADLLKLEIGDVIKLTSDVATPVELRMEDVPVSRGHPEIVGGNIALRLTERLEGPSAKKAQSGEHHHG